MESKTVKLGFCFPRRGFWTVGTEFKSLSVELGFWNFLGVGGVIQQNNEDTRRPRQVLRHILPVDTKK